MRSGASAGASVQNVARRERDFEKELDKARDPDKKVLSEEELRDKPWSSEQKRAYEKVVRQNIRHRESEWVYKPRSFHKRIKSARDVHDQKIRRQQNEEKKQRNANNFVRKMISIRVNEEYTGSSRYNTMRVFFERGRGRDVLCHAQNKKTVQERKKIKWPSKKHLLKAGLLAELNEWIGWRSQKTGNSLYDFELISNILSCLIGGITVGQNVHFFPFYKLARGASGRVTVTWDVVKMNAFKGSFNETPRMRWSLKHKDYDATPPGTRSSKVLDIWGELGGKDLLDTLKKLTRAFFDGSHRVQGYGAEKLKRKLASRSTIALPPGPIGWTAEMRTPVWEKIFYAVNQWETGMIEQGIGADGAWEDVERSRQERRERR